MLDESALTGESLPVDAARRRAACAAARSTPAAPFELRASATAGRQRVRGARAAGARGARRARAPFVRLADRYAAVFLPAHPRARRAAWAVSGDPVRALAVLVVATPCPLILAAPIAIVVGHVARRARAASSSRTAARSSGLAARAPCCSTRPGTLTPRHARGRRGSCRCDGFGPTSCCASPPPLDQVSRARAGRGDRRSRRRRGAAAQPARRT